MNWYFLIPQLSECLVSRKHMKRREDHEHDHEHRKKNKRRKNQAARPVSFILTILTIHVMTEG